MSETNRIELVVIGVSAGGVEALGRLLPALPADLNAAVAVVLHIPPDRHSRLPELFAPRCRLALKEVEDKEPVQANTVYFAPPDYHMLVEPGGSFSLSQDEPVNFSRPSIDMLFESAALAYRASVLGIILTGASADGAAGLKSLREAGGTAWVQDPDDAAMPVMPASAISEAGADRILSLNQMASLLSSPTALDLPRQLSS